MVQSDLRLEAAPLLLEGHPEPQTASTKTCFCRSGGRGTIFFWFCVPPWIGKPLLDNRACNGGVRRPLRALVFDRFCTLSPFRPPSAPRSCCEARVVVPPLLPGRRPTAASVCLFLLGASALLAGKGRENPQPRNLLPLPLPSRCGGFGAIGGPGRALAGVKVCVFFEELPPTLPEGPFAHTNLHRSSSIPLEIRRAATPPTAGLTWIAPPHHPGLQTARLLEMPEFCGPRCWQPTEPPPGRGGPGDRSRRGMCPHTRCGRASRQDCGCEVVSASVPSRLPCW